MAAAEDGAPQAGQTLPRRLRVRKRREFERIRLARRSVRDGVLKLGWCENGGAETRLGLAVSRRVGSAVTRNRIKRILREAFRRRRPDWPRGLDVVLIPLDAARAADLETASRSLAGLMDRVLRKRGGAAR